MKKSKIVLSYIIFLPSLSFAAGLDKSGQSVNDIMWKNHTYAEIGYSLINPDVSGKDKGLSSLGEENNTKNIVEKSTGMRWAVKSNINDSLSLGIIFDQPFSSNVKHQGKSDFISTLPNGDSEGTTASFESQNFTGLLGWDVSPKFTVLGGASLQEIEGNVKLRGDIYKGSAHYDVKLKSDKGVGWVVGAVFKNPKLGLKTGITYRSEIKHETKTIESFNKISDQKYINSSTFITPESVNLDFQTALNQTTLLNLNLRWVPWSDFKFAPYKLNERTAMNRPDKRGTPLLSYEKDQWSAQLGLSHKLNPKWAISGAISWDSGLGDPANALGPVNGYWGAGGGVQYNINRNFSFGVGAKYLWLGDAEAKRQNGDIVGDFSNNSNVALGLKLSYQSK